MTDASVTSRNLSAVFLMRIAQFPILALFVILVPRMMGPEVYGQFALLISIATILASLVNLGIGDTCGRYVPELQARGGNRAVVTFASNFLAFKSLVTIVALGLITPGLYWMYGNGASPVMFVIVALMVLVVDWESVVYSLLFGQNRLMRFSVREPLRRVVSLALILTLFPQFGLMGALFSTLMAELAMLVLGGYWTRKSFTLRDLRPDLGALEPYLKFGAAVYLVWLFLNLWQRLGNLLIEHLLRDSSEVAYFDIANQFFLVILSITVMIINSLIPIFSTFAQAGRGDTVAAWSRRLVKYVTILNMTAFGGLLILGADLIPMLIGGDFEDVYPNVIVLSVALFPSVLIQIGFVHAVVDKRPRRFLGALVLALAAYVLLSLALIPQFRSVGCSIATTASYWLMAALVTYPIRTRVGPVLKDACAVIAVGLPVLALALLKAETLMNLVLAASFILIYVSLLILLRWLTVSELRQVLDALRGRGGESQSGEAEHTRP
jgi:O-antigen/teichoic acid export membrane protein